MCVSEDIEESNDEEDVSELLLPMDRPAPVVMDVDEESTHSGESVEEEIIMDNDQDEIDVDGNVVVTDGKDCDDSEPVNEGEEELTEYVDDVEDYVIEDTAVDMEDTNSDDGEVFDNANNHDSEYPGKTVVSDSEGIEVAQVDNPDESKDEIDTTGRNQLRPGLRSARPPVNNHQNRFEAEYNYANIEPKGS